MAQRGPADDEVAFDVYNATAAHQTVRAPGRIGQTRSFTVRIADDPVWPGGAQDSFRGHFVVHGSTAAPGSDVQYLAGKHDITSEMLSDDGYQVEMDCNDIKGDTGPLCPPISIGVRITVKAWCHCRNPPGQHGRQAPGTVITSAPTPSKR